MCNLTFYICRSDVLRSSQAVSDHSYYSDYSSPVYCLPNIMRKISVPLVNAIVLFKDFLLSQWVGSNSNSPVNMHITNITFLLNGITERQLFDADVLNLYLSKKRNCGVAPFTLISRLIL